MLAHLHHSWLAQVRCISKQDQPVVEHTLWGEGLAICVGSQIGGEAKGLIDGWVGLQDKHGGWGQPRHGLASYSGHPTVPPTLVLGTVSPQGVWAPGGITGGDHMGIEAAQAVGMIWVASVCSAVPQSL